VGVFVWLTLGESNNQAIQVCAMIVLDIAEARQTIGDGKVAQALMIGVIAL